MVLFIKLYSVRLLDLFGAVIIWDPYTESIRSQIERVQRKLLSFAANMLKVNHRPHDHEPVLLKLKL